MKKIAEAQRELSLSQKHLADAVDKLYEDAQKQLLKEGDVRPKDKLQSISGRKKGSGMEREDVGKAGEGEPEKNNS